MKKRIFFIVCLVLILSGCSLIPKFPSLSPPERPKTVYNWHEEEVIEPIGTIQYLDGDKEKVHYKVKRTVSANLDQGPVKLTFMQRAGNFLSNMSFLLFVALVIGLVFFPLTTLPFVLGQLGKYRKALKQTVSAIDKTNGSAKAELKIKLADKHDADTKTLISKLKREV